MEHDKEGITDKHIFFHPCLSPASIGTSFDFTTGQKTQWHGTKGSWGLDVCQFPKGYQVKLQHHKVQLYSSFWSLTRIKENGW